MGVFVLLLNVSTWVTTMYPTATKFGNLSVGGGGGERDTGVEAGSGSGEGDDVFKNMDAQCKVCMQETKVRHPASYFVDDFLR